MSDLPRLHASSTRLILGLRDGLERLEATEHGLRPGDPSILAKDLQVKLAELQRISRELDSSWRMALVRQQTAKHDVWKRWNKLQKKLTFCAHRCESIAAERQCGSKRQQIGQSC
eukprot:GHRR01023418.1.p1 GENE.GHRR01023418.1~~GHRR01023418.1.p1  ORF type:complete len:115 (+),score=16.32 GHRR01023418.1:166-510(+)